MTDFWLRGLKFDGQRIKAYWRVGEGGKAERPTLSSLDWAKEKSEEIIRMLRSNPHGWAGPFDQTPEGILTPYHSWPEFWAAAASGELFHLPVDPAWHQIWFDRWAERVKHTQLKGLAVLELQELTRPLLGKHRAAEELRYLLRSGLGGKDINRRIFYLSAVLAGHLPYQPEMTGNELYGVAARLLSQGQEDNKNADI